MKKILNILIIILLLSCILSPFLLAETEKELLKTFDADKKLKLELVLGDCNIEKSTDSKIHLTVRYTYSDEDFKVNISERSKSIHIEEKLSNNPKGYSNWFLSVPDNAEIDFESATGSLSVENTDIELDASSGTGKMELSNCKGEYDLNTGTGRVEVSNSSGEFKLNTGTGRVEITSSEGAFDANSGTGRVHVKKVTIHDDSEFNSGTGTVKIESSECKDIIDVTLSSGTGSAILDMSGKKLKGYYELSANNNHGRIVCPVKFDGEEKQNEGDRNRENVRKWFTKDSDFPRYFIQTGTGKAELKL